MEDDKKKKRNKKKKNKQAKPADGSLAVGDHNHVPEQNNLGEVSKSADVQNDAMLTGDADPDRHHSNGTGGATLAETIKQSQHEKVLHIQKEVGLEMKIAEIHCEKDLWLQKEATLEETAKQLQNEKDMHIQKKADLEMRIATMQDEKNARLDEQIGQLLYENATLSLKGETMEEEIKILKREKDSWILQENRTKDAIARLNDDNIKQRLQVMELEDSQNNLLRENQKLVENISILQSQIQSLEVAKDASANEELSLQIDAALVLVDKLVTENAELVEKVNELYSERDRHTMAGGFSSSNPIIGNKTSDVAHSIPEPREMTAESVKQIESLSAVLVKDESSDRNTEVQHGAEVLNCSETGKAEEITQIPVSEEIVQIPLDESEVQDLESQAAESDEKAPLPLSDAPLIGAPFRLASFMAKYVSGADLVSRKN